MRDVLLKAETVETVAKIIASYVRSNSIKVSELSTLIASVHTVIASLRSGDAAAGPQSDRNPAAVSIKQSITDSHLICLEDGKKFKSLKRHLSAHHGLSPVQYRAKWGLPSDYPMLAPAYAAKRTALAKTLGLGMQRENPALPSQAKKGRKAKPQ